MRESYLLFGSIGKVDKQIISERRSMALNPGPHSCRDEYEKTTYQSNLENIASVGR